MGAETGSHLPTAMGVFGITQLDNGDWAWWATYGRSTLGGQSSSKDAARRRAEDAYRELGGSPSSEASS